MKKNFLMGFVAIIAAFIGFIIFILSLLQKSRLFLKDDKNCKDGNSSSDDDAKFYDNENIEEFDYYGDSDKYSVVDCESFSDLQKKDDSCKDIG